MPKRKRATSAAEEDASDAARPSIKQLRAEQKLDHGQKLLGRAFKTARGFERQKLGRRRKTATTSANAEKDITRIDEETAALKTLDLHAVATIYLNKSLLKFKAVAQSSDLPRQLSNPAQQPSDPAALNVVARLCNSNPVKEALTPILHDIQRALGLETTGSDAKSAKRVRAEKKAVAQITAQVHEQSLSASEDDDRLRKVADDREEGAEDSEEEFADFDARIAGSSSDEGEDSDGQDFRQHSSDEDAVVADLLSIDSDDEDDLKASHPAGAEPKKGGKNLERAISPSSSGSQSPPPDSKPRSAKSQFIPRLTMGGYISGSDSETFSDLDEPSKQKKNRRGQRARQAIWEKKFGGGAKHVISGNAKADRRSDGWDMKRGATDRARGRGDGKVGRGRGRGGATVVRQSRVDDKENKPKPKHRDDEGSLHPSWAAAKKAKEQATQSASFQGKRVTFD